MSKEATTVPRMLHKMVDADPASPANRKIVHTQDDLDAALKDGWHLSADDLKPKAHGKAHV